MILSPYLKKWYYVNESSIDKDLERERCNKIFRIDLAKASDCNKNSKQTLSSEDKNSTPKIPENNIWKNWK